MRKFVVPIILMALTSFSVWAKAGLKERADLQFYLCGKPSSIIAALGLTSATARLREVHLFESPRFDFYDRGIATRLRIKDQTATLTVKRFGLSEEDYLRYKSSLSAECEVDVHNNGELPVRSCASDLILSPKTARAILKGDSSLMHLLSSTQLTLVADASTHPGAVLNGVMPLGPIESRAWRWTDAGENFTLDVQKFPGKARFVELSLKTGIDGIQTTALRIIEALQKRGLKLCEDQSGQREMKLRALLACEQVLAH